MSRSTTPPTAAEHVREARRILDFVHTGPLHDDENREYTAVYARDPMAVAAVATAHAALAQYEEQHTANLIAFHADDTTAPDDYTVSDGSAQIWWQALVGSIRERLGLA